MDNSSRFQDVRVHVSPDDDAFAVARKVEVALTLNGATPEEINAFRKDVYNSDDALDAARRWVDPY